ncbi:MAG: outer membrane lipoprotein-sorting protein [Bacteroidota bacterium]
MNTILMFLCSFSIMLPSNPDADKILERVDQNLSSRNRVVESTMIIHGRRQNRTITSRTYIVGDTKSFTEYLSPAREQGTKMLKLEDQMWIYSPDSDRTIQISGHMLRQSVMGSDLSYEDMMDDRKLQEVYNAEITGETSVEGRICYQLQLNAKVDDASYESQKLWIDKERYIPLKQELYAKGGQLLKRITLSEIERIEGRWFPMKMIYKDVLKEGDGTGFCVNSIRFNQDIPGYIFSKAALKQ